jgi:hypothetical protein
MKIRRLADRAAGAIVATAILTGGAAYAANGADDSPRAAAVAADDRGGVVVTAAPADDSRSATRIADDGPRRRDDATAVTPTTAPAGTPAVEDRTDVRSDRVDDNPGAGDRGGRSAGVPAPSLGTSPSTTSTTSVASAPVTARPASEVRTAHCTGGSATIVRSDAALALVGASPTSGWSTEVRHRGPIEVDVRFVAGERSCRLKAELEDGALRIRVEER